MKDEKKPRKKLEKTALKKKKKLKEEPEEVISNGLPKDVDFKKFLGCGG